MFGVFSAALYLLSNTHSFFNLTNTSTKSLFNFLSGYDLYWFLVTPLVLFLLLNMSWTGPNLLAWFGHITFTAMQYKITYLSTTLFLLVWTTYVTSFYFASKDVFDYTSVTYSLFIWTTLLFSANNIFTAIFFIEILSTLIMLLVITSTFSTTLNYNTLDLTNHHFFNNTLPVTFLQSLLFFFWMSLLGSLSLFFFTILFFTKFLTFDWTLCELVFRYFTVGGSWRDVLFALTTWFTFIFCIFLKCGLPPFFFLKAGVF